ncbi:MAG: hypothetical protein IT430_18285 [Phycisphaerales bacterium]|nr:hypothetical protein [Phycisphaerales bacterium]
MKCRLSVVHLRRHPPVAACLTITAATVLMASGVARAQERWVQTRKLLAEDGHPNAYFGWCVGMSGDSTVISAPQDHESGLFSGAFYVFDQESGRQLQKVSGHPPRVEGRFGWTLAVDHDRVVAADPYGNSYADRGSVVVFDLPTGKALRRLECTNSDDPFPNFCEIALQGRIAVVGCPSGVEFKKWTGAAYVFDIATGEQLLRILAPDAHDGQAFGSAVAIGRDRIVVSAYFDETESLRTGSVYVFDSPTGEYLYKLQPPDPVEGMSFGECLAVSGDRLAVSAYHDDVNGPLSGSVYIYDINAGRLLHKIAPADGIEGQSFGWALAIDGQRLVVGASYDDDMGFRSGSAYVYDLSTFELVAKLSASDGEEFEQFGNAVAIQGGRIVIGARACDDLGGTSGAAYVFESSNLLRISPDPLIAGEAGTFDVFGALPDRSIWLLYSLRGVGSTYIPHLNVTADLCLPRLASERGLTDSAGDWTTTLVMPRVEQMTSVWFQAVQRESTTNVAKMLIISD